MTTKEQDMFEEYKGDLVRIINTTQNTSFFGVLKDINHTHVTLSPYLNNAPNQDGQTIYNYCSEGKPLKVKIDEIFAIHPVEMRTIDNIVSDYDRIARVNQMKSRIDKLQTELNLKDMEEAHRKKFKSMD